MKNTVLVCLAALLMSLPLLAQAQPIPEMWSVVLYDREARTLATLSPLETTVTPLPADPDPSPFEVSLTDDGRYLVSIIDFDEFQTREEVHVTDLSTGETRVVEPPPLPADERFGGYRFGIFNAAMTEAALSVISYPPQVGQATSGGIMTADLATGTITHYLRLSEIFPGRGDWSTATITAWTLDGIRFGPHCTQCAPLNVQFNHVWEPTTNTLSTSEAPDQYGQRLAATGELLRNESRLDFPLGGGGPYMPHRNTIVLYQADESPANSSGQVVYFNMETITQERYASWIMNGRAFIVNDDEAQHAVVFRDGHQFTFEYAWDRFLTMTSAGWLAQDETTHEVRLYTVTSDTVASQVVYAASGDIQIANAQLAPVTEDLGEFAIDIEPPEGFFCRGALPSRLQPGDWATVPFGAPMTPVPLVVGDIRLDEIDWQTAQRITLAEGSRVLVLEGPECLSHTTAESAPETAYVKVVYQGQIGWMMEVWYTVYGLEPVP